MILTVDIGNSNIVVGFADEATQKVISSNRVPTDRNRSQKEYLEDLRGIAKVADVNPLMLEGGIISSSVPVVTERLRLAAERLLEKSVLVVGPGVKTDVEMGIEDPSQLGPDLLSAAVGGISVYKTPLIIVDLGTATTYSVIDKDSRFLGGMISPGAASSLEGLLARASHLPWIEFEKPREVISGDTKVAMQSGLIYGHASTIDGMVQRIWEDLGYETTVVATGGLAPIIVPLCKNESIIIDEDLLLKGMILLYLQNRKEESL